MLLRLISRLTLAMLAVSIPAMAIGQQTGETPRDLFDLNLERSPSSQQPDVGYQRPRSGGSANTAWAIQESTTPNQGSANRGSMNKVQPAPNNANQGADWNVESVMQAVDSQADINQQQAGQADSVWWTRHVTQSVDSRAQAVQVNVGDLIMMALEHSAQVSVARALPQIRETAIVGAQAEFDWSKYVDTRWVDSSEPVGSALTLGGGGGTRFREHDFSIEAGLRRKLFNGADFYTYQRFGHLDNNSSFLIPPNQATSRIVVGFTQPLLRGRGEVYNTSLILLANIDAGSANDEFHRQLQAHLLEVARGYWALYLERANLAQQVGLYLKTQKIVDQLNSRANIDAQRSQVISANAALESRKADLIRARAAVKNAETRLRALINAPELQTADSIEMIPAEHPSVVEYPTENHIEFETALQNRPEIAAALKAIRAGSIRLQMSDHEILPSLNLVTEAYVAGLRGESDIGNAWLDQFREGEPGYSIGLQYEVPLGRRAAFSNLQRRQVEVRQLQEQYRSTLELIRAEVEVAVRELKTSYLELNARYKSLKAAEAEAETLTARWNELGDQGSTGGLLLESLLRAQERVTQFENEFAQAQLTYSLSLINLRHANGTLYQTTNHTDIGNPSPHPPVQQSWQHTNQPVGNAGYPLYEMGRQNRRSGSSGSQVETQLFQPPGFDPLSFGTPAIPAIPASRPLSSTVGSPGRVVDGNASRGITRVGQRFEEQFTERLAEPDPRSVHESPGPDSVKPVSATEPLTESGSNKPDLSKTAWRKLLR